jgi:hypothetical protein
VIRLAWRAHGPSDDRELNLGVVVAVLLASLAAGFMGGFIIWALWRYDLLQLGDRHRRA